MMRTKLAIFSAVCWLAWVAAAAAQSNPGLIYGQVPTAAQWNSYFSAKQDVIGYVPLNRAGGTMTGELVTTASTNANSGFNIQPGVAPGAPSNGDVWVTTAGMFVRVNGSTVGPLVGGTPTTNLVVGTSTITAGTPNGILYDQAGVVGNTVAGNNGVLVTSAGGAPSISSTLPTAVQANITTFGAVTVTAAPTFNVAGIGSTPTDGLIIENTTAAGAGAQQWSPRLRLTGQGWKTTATAASQEVDWTAQVVPVQGSSAPSSNLVLSEQVNGGGYSPVATLTSGGAFGLGTESNPQYGLTYSRNAATGLAFSGSPTVALFAEVDATIGRVTLASWGANTAGFDGYSTGGSAGSPSATAAGTQLNGLGGRGYANGAYTTSASPALIAEMSLNNWTASDTSTYITFNTTPSGSTTRALAMRVQASGGVSVGTTTDPGIGSYLGTGSLLVNGTGGVGYATGAGGTVSQATSKSTTVVLNKTTGAITMNSATLNAATIVSFTLTNSTIAATDVILLNHISGGTPGAYTLNAQAASGSATINVRNNTAGNLGEAIVIEFAVVKGVTS